MASGCEQDADARASGTIDLHTSHCQFSQQEVRHRRRCRFMSGRVCSQVTSVFLNLKQRISFQQDAFAFDDVGSDAAVLEAPPDAFAIRLRFLMEFRSGLPRELSLQLP